MNAPFLAQPGSHAKDGTMKLWILSDLHQEFPQFVWKPDQIPEHDVLVLAGDIHKPIEKAIAFARTLTIKPVILVAGNHECYGQILDEVPDQGRTIAAQYPNIYFLENESVVISGTRFVGCTLWTDMLLPVPHSGLQTIREYTIEKQMNDYRAIKRIGESTGKKRRIRPKHTITKHKQSFAYLERELEKTHSGPTVVVTHHAPISDAFKPSERNAMLAPAYATDLTDFITAKKPELWIYGHTHHANDTQIATTRLVSNPRGYGGEQTGFDENKIVEL